MDFDIDFDDLGDLDNLDCDWDNDSLDVQEDIQDQEESPSSQQQEQQLGHPQQQSQQPQPPPQPQPIESGSSNDIYSPNTNGNGHCRNSIGNQDQGDGFATPGNIAQSNIDPQAPATPNTGNSSGEAFQIRLDREREGRCADCGAQTHEVQFDPSGSGRAIKVPLSVPGEVHRGRCLFCHPLPAARSHKRADNVVSSSKTRHQQQQQPEGLHGNGYVEENQLDGHLNSNRPQTYQNISSSASVGTASSQQSSHSIYSQQSAPTWGGGKQQQQAQYQQANSNGFGADFVENYQQQQYLQQQLQRQQMQQQQQQQYNQYPDDGSVYSHASRGSHASHHSIHSHASHQSQASYHSFNQQISSPQLNPTNIDTQFQRSSSNNSFSVNTSAGAAAEVIYRQMLDETLDLETCIQAMRSFPSHSLIQEKGCALLWAGTNNAQICAAMSNMGVVSVILDAMRNHARAPNLQRAGCEALRNLCVNSRNRQLLFQAGGVSILVNMMEQHVDNPEIQGSGCTTLASMAEGGMEYKIAVAECGGILAVMKAVEIHPESDLVLRAAYQALRMLGYNPGAKSGG